MTRSRSLALISTAILTAWLAGCATTADPAPASPAAHSGEAAPAGQAAASPAEPDDLEQDCIEMFTRNRTCTDTYIPALVDLRVRYDQPPGIADAVATDRDAVIAKAMEEWASDSTDSAIAATCKKIVASMPGAIAADAPAARECLAEQDCPAYTRCVMPLVEKRFSR
jgi:hypothetical protein